VAKAGVTVSGGLFSVALDFGQAVFNGEARFLEVGVKPAGASGAYTVLSPRTALTAVPYALGIPGLFVQPGTVRAEFNLGMSGYDFFMTANDRGDGGRAMVHGEADALILNHANDFAGGTFVGSKLQVAGEVLATDTLQVRNADGTKELTLFVYGEGGVDLGSATNNIFIRSTNHAVFINSGPEDGFVGIGTAGPESKLHVVGDVRVSGGSFIDDGTVLNVPDYVFEEDYHLMPLDELAAYIAREKHLPNVPSQDEIHRDGLNLSQFHMRLLEKVEELTLYTLAQQEQLDAQQQVITALEVRLSALEQGE
jgi:hypothetical protein